MAIGAAAGVLVSLVLFLGSSWRRAGPPSAERDVTEEGLPFEPPRDLAPLPPRGDLKKLKLLDHVNLKYRVELARHTFNPQGGRFSHVMADFERIARKRLDMERVLVKVYGRRITPRDLEAEWKRISTNTKAPEVLDALVRSLGRREDLILEGICRPLLVERFIREEFQKDRDAQAERRKLAEGIRSGLTRESFKERAGEHYERRHFASPGAPPVRGPERLYPLSGVLKKEVDKLEPGTQSGTGGAGRKLPGEISGVFETPNAFQIVMLVSRGERVITLDMAMVKKLAFDEWFEKARRW